MKNKLMGRCLSLGLVMVLLCACHQSEIAPNKPVSTGLIPSVRSSEVGSSSALPSDPQTSSNRTTPIAQAAPPIATFQTQPQTTGFSADGQHFVHLESWRDTGAGIPHAAIQVINLPSNTCVTKGCLRTQFDESQADQKIGVAENELLQKTQQLRQDLQLMAPTTGTTLPVLSRSRAENGTETVTVRLQNNQSMRVILKQKQVVSTLAGGTAEKDQAAMQLEISYGGKTRSLGSLSQLQDWMVGFSIREVKQSPNGKTIAILLTGAERAFEGTLGRTLIQGLEL